MNGMIAGRGVFVVSRFVDDYGNHVIPCYMCYDTFMARYFYYNEGMIGE